MLIAIACSDGTVNRHLENNNKKINTVYLATGQHNGKTLVFCDSHFSSSNDSPFTRIQINHETYIIIIHTYTKQNIRVHNMIIIIT